MSDLYIVFSDDAPYQSAIRMSKQQAKAISWLIDEFRLHLSIEPGAECDVPDLETDDYDWYKR